MMSPSNMRPAFLRLRARRGCLLLLVSPPGRLARLAFVAGLRTPHLRCLVIHRGGQLPSGPGDRPIATGARHPKPVLRVA